MGAVGGGPGYRGGMETLPVAAEDRRAVPLWRNLSFQLTWSSTAASGFGDRMIELAAMPMLGIAAAGEQASVAMAAIYFWFFLPWLVITPVGGWLADTLPRKLVMFACDEGRALVLLLAVFMVPAGWTTLDFAHLAPGEMTQTWKIFAVLAAVGALAAIFSPTRNALIPQIVAPRQLNAANSMILGIGVIASLIGFVIGGYLLQHHSVRMGIVIALMCYGITGAFWLFLHPTPHRGMDRDRHLSEWTRLIRAGHYIRVHRPVLRLIILNALLWSVAMIVAPAMGALVKQRYGITEDIVWRISLLSAMLGLGMLASAIWVTWMNVRREADLTIAVVLGVTGVSLSALALSQNFAQGMVLSLATGFCGGSLIIIISTLTQAIVPNFILGRVGGVREVLSNITAVAINLLVWQLPLLRKINNAWPEADPILIMALHGLAVILVGFGVWTLVTRLCRGPLDSALANLLWRVGRSYALVWHRVQWVGRHHVPTTGPVILAANHTTALDPFVIQSAVPRVVAWLMLRQYQFRIVGFLWRTAKPIALEPGTGELGKIREVLKRLAAGHIVGLFPEGQLQRTHRDLAPFQAGVGLIALRSGATIVPVWIQGTPQVQHMLWHFLRPSRTTVIFGKPYKPEAGMDAGAVTQDLRQRMLALHQAEPV